MSYNEVQLLLPMGGRPAHNRKLGSHVERRCELCHRLFRAFTPDVKRGRGRWCSIRCWAKWLRVTGARRGIRSAIKRECIKCGSHFTVKPSHIASGKSPGKYCTVVCAHSRHPAKITLQCPECGAVRHRSPSYARTVFCSRRCALTHRYRMHGQWNNGHQRGRGGKRADLGDMYFRSSWEANWARFLKWQKEHGAILNWEYEPQTFEFAAIKRGTRFYTPDFRVTRLDGSVEWHEVKGWMDAKSKTRHRRFKKYFPTEHLRIVGRKDLAAIRRQLRGMVALE